MPNFWGIVMAKYSTEAKRKVVYEYLAGHGSYETLSKLYHVLCAPFGGGYQAFVIDGLRCSRAQQIYTF